MAPKTFSLLPLILSLLFSVAISASYIDDSCKATTYPAECVKLLTPYSDTIQNSPRNMAQTALTVGLTQAKSGMSLVATLVKAKNLKSNEYKALDVCLDQMDNSVDMFSQSIEELKVLIKDNNNQLAWRINNIQTWVSAGLTSQDTCLDAFADMGLNGKDIQKVVSEATIAKKVISEATIAKKVTSNALALVNKFLSETKV